MEDNKNDWDVSDDEIDIEEGENVQVKFTTKLEDKQWQAPLSAYYVPISLTRYGLSEVLNNLLQLEKPQAFDILIEEKFLRTSLQKYMKARSISHEDVILELEYVLALEAPKEKGECQHEDWISSLDTDQRSYCCSGGYDGTVRFWTNKGQEDPFQFICSAVISAHRKPIKDIQLLKKGETGCQLLTASQDFTVKWWDVKKIQKEKEESLMAARKDSELGEFFGHKSSVESISIAITEDKFISGSFDGMMLAWDLNDTDFMEDNDERNDEGESAAKKQKTFPKRKPILTMDDHVGCISSLNWIKEETCWSGSWDHSIRCWDLPTGICTQKMYGGTSIYSIACSKESSIILSGHADRIIRLWDPRSKSKLIIGQFKSHKAWIPSVQWHPTNPNLFSSASHDKTIKIWDMRSELPLHTLESHEDKALCVSWHNNETLLSGGADRKLKVHQFTL